ncbi:hypothetical protein Ancab_009877 [Ancistrocladus abbreviatus]
MTRQYGRKPRGADDVAESLAPSFFFYFFSFVSLTSFRSFWLLLLLLLQHFINRTNQSCSTFFSDRFLPALWFLPLEKGSGGGDQVSRHSLKIGKEGHFGCSWFLVRCFVVESETLVWSISLGKPSYY